MSALSQAALTDLIAERTAALLPTLDTTPIPAPTPTSASQLAAAIDHTLLKPTATSAQIRQLCQEAATHNFASVCVNPTWVALAAEELRTANAVVCTVIGFPLGATLTTAKVAETEAAIAQGAREVDMVLTIGHLKEENYAAVHADIVAVVTAAHAQNAIVKVIIETCLLTPAEKIAASLLVKAAGADFVKTSTGFSTGGATVADVQLMRRAVGPNLGIKAAGGVRSAADAFQMFAVGATRIGASAGVAILTSMATSGGVDDHPSQETQQHVAEGKQTY